MTHHWSANDIALVRRIVAEYDTMKCVVNPAPDNEWQQARIEAARLAAHIVARS